MEWKILYQIPLTSPKSGINVNDMSMAKKPSTINVILKMKCSKRIIPPTAEIEMEFAKVERARYPIRLPVISAKDVITVITPRPPIWIRIIMTSCPKKVQYVAVSYTTNPVTQTHDVDVNSALINGVHCPDWLANGVVSNNAPNTIIAPNPRIIICGYVKCSLFLRKFIISFQNVVYTYMILS